MLIRIIRSGFVNYKVYLDNELSFEINNNSKFRTEIFFLYSNSKDLLAAYKEHRYVISNRREMHLFEFDQVVAIENKKSGVRFFLDYNCYELRYVFFKFKGFYFNDELVATLHVKSQTLGAYVKEVTVLKEIPHYHFFILFYVAIDCFDVN